jgi:hypothetical protein
VARSWAESNRAWLERARRWLPRLPEPVTLRAWLWSPIAWDPYDGVTIEGAIQSAVILRETGRSPDDVFAGCPPTLTEIPIPIVDVEIDGLPIAMVSWAQPDPEAVDAMRWRRKRARVEEYAIHRVTTSGGAYKSQNIPVPTMVTSYVDFHAFADRELLAELLPDTGAIGRSRAGGLGAVMGWELLPDPEERALSWGGRPMRTVPLGAGVGELVEGSYEIRPATTRAPYWHRGSLCECIVPVPGGGRLATEAA